MDGRVQVIRHRFFGNHDSILEVVSLPRHERHHQVTSKGQFTVFGGIAFCQNIPFLDFLTFRHDRTLVETGVLVRSSELQKLVILDIRVEADQLFCICALVCYFNMLSVNRFHHTSTFCEQHHAGVYRHTVFQTGTHNRSLGAQKRHGLAHHVGSHQRTVSVIVLQERDQRCGD